VAEVSFRPSVLRLMGSVAAFTAIGDGLDRWMGHTTSAEWRSAARAVMNLNEGAAVPVKDWRLPVGLE